MAVAHSSTVPAVTHANTTTITSPSWTISGSNGVILVGITLASTTITVSSVTWSLGSGTAVQIASARGGSGNSGLTSVWAIPAPTTGAGTVAVTVSSAVDFDFGADFFTGADQTTPCPIADATTSVATTTPQTLTPANLTANDASFMTVCSIATSISSITPNQTLVTNVPSASIGVGYNTGATGVTATYAATGDDRSLVAVRIAAVAAASDTLWAQTCL